MAVIMFIIYGGYWSIIVVFPLLVVYILALLLLSLHCHCILLVILFKFWLRDFVLDLPCSKVFRWDYTLESITMSVFISVSCASVNEYRTVVVVSFIKLSVCSYYYDII